MFVTGTGTDVGKTFVTAGLIRVLRARAVGLGLETRHERIRSGECEREPSRGLARRLATTFPRQRWTRYRRGGSLRRCHQIWSHAEKAAPSTSRPWSTSAGGDALLVEGVGGIIVLPTRAIRCSIG